MRRLQTLYIAGPEPWLPEAGERLAVQRRMCEQLGFTLLIPDPAALVETDRSEVMAREIYAERNARLRLADVGLVNLTPFRGPGCDPGAAFEAGVMAGLGKPVFGWLNIESEEEASYLDRVENQIGAVLDEEGVWRDLDGCEIEDFGLPEGLMLWAEMRGLFVVATPDPFGDLTGLRLCLDALRQYAE